MKSEVQPVNLRPYQENLVNKCREAFQAQGKRILAYLPTGAGKTQVAARMIQDARAKGRYVAVVCNRVQLVAQISQALVRLGIFHGVLQGDNSWATQAPVLVCSIQTLATRGLPDEYKFIIIDECHACPGTQAYVEIMSGRWVIGLTATPFRHGMAQFVEALNGPLFERVVVGATMRDLIDEGWLVDAEVWAPADPDLQGVAVVDGDYHEDQVAERMAPLTGDVVATWLKHSIDGDGNCRQTMVFACNIAHSQSLCEEFRRAFAAAGLDARCSHVDYQMSDDGPDGKKSVYADFKAGRTTVLCNVALLSEGADFPGCEVLVLARPTRSQVRFVQMFGRILRPSVATGKTTALVLDHSGTVKRLGFPWDFDVSTLDDGARKEQTAEGRGTTEVLPKACPRCAFVAPVRVTVCPKCLFQRHATCTISSAEGDLVPITKVLKGVPGLEAMGRTRVYHQLRELGRQRGHDDQWARIKFKEAFGEWPTGLPAGEEEPSPVVKGWEQSQRIRWFNSKRKRTK